MTKEQEAIDYVQKQIDYFKKQIKFIEAVDKTYYEAEYKLYKNRVKQLETVLFMLKQKDAEIEEYKRMIAAGIINVAKDELIQEKNKELEQKDKQINLMADYLAINGVERDVCNEKRIKENCENATVYNCKECIKQYFEKLVERKSENGN